MSNTLLEGITIIDFSNRLPGPLAGKILSDLGAIVIKIEDNQFKDPFLDQEISKFDPSFVTWYETLNAKKKIKYFDFNSESDQKEIFNLISKADAVIMGLPKFTRQKLKVTNEDLHFNKSFVALELHASSISKNPMHDLNALASSGLLSLYIGKENKKIIPPPFLPIAGISFGQKIATELIAGLLKSRIKNQTIFLKSYLEDNTLNLLGIFWSKKDRENANTKYLHNGKYPCYSIYQTKDLSYIALAAVEEKFWNKFCEIFKIKTNLDRFYCHDDQLFKLISDKLNSLTLLEIKNLIGTEDICLTAIV